MQYTAQYIDSNGNTVTAKFNNIQAYTSYAREYTNKGYKVVVVGSKGSVVAIFKRRTLI